MVFSTNAARTGLNGHPWGRPSSCWKLFHSPFGSWYKHVVGSDNNRFAKSAMFGKCVFMISRALSLGISLNMFCISIDIKHLVGGLISVSPGFLVMYLSISLLIV